MSEDVVEQEVVYSDLTEDELRMLARIPEFVTPQDGEDVSRTQVNVSRTTHDLLKLWLKAELPGTVREICDRAIRLWLMVYGNVIGQDEKLRFKESRTGQDLKAQADRVQRDVSARARSSPSVLQAHVVRIGTHMATSLLRAKGVDKADDDLYHEMFEAARTSGRRVGEEIAERLRLASLLLSACPEVAGVNDKSELMHRLEASLQCPPAGGGDTTTATPRPGHGGRHDRKIR